PRDLHPVALGGYPGPCLGTDAGRPPHQRPHAALHSVRLYLAGQRRTSRLNPSQETMNMQDLISRHLVRYLEDRGVEHVFCLCGRTDSAVLTELGKSDKIRFVNTRHEQIASHAADGYARMTRKASVVLSHLGPGLTNAATGVANAALDSIPMVVIAGDIPSHYYGKHPH